MRIGKRNIIVSVIVVLVLLSGFYFRSMVGAFIIHSENTGTTELQSMLSSRLFPGKYTQVEIKGRKYLVPFPTIRRHTQAGSIPSRQIGNSI